MDTGVFSFSQALGYCAFVFGIAALMQRVEWKLKALMSLETLAYLAHFAMLGNTAAAASAAVSCTRSVLSIRYRSKALGAIFIGLHITTAFFFVHDAWGLLPVVGSCVATWAFFATSGVRMRLLIMFCTCMWLINNIHSGSIGGTGLETFMLLTNALTIRRLMADKQRNAMPAQTAPQSEGETVTAIARAMESM